MLSALVLPRSRVAFGAVIGPVVGVTVLWLAKEPQPCTVLVTAAGVCCGTLLRNVMLNIRHANGIDGDIPFAPFPISWQDTGTGVFSFAFAVPRCSRPSTGTNQAVAASGSPVTQQQRALVMDIHAW